MENLCDELVDEDEPGTMIATIRTKHLFRVDGMCPRVLFREEHDLRKGGRGDVGDARGKMWRPSFSQFSTRNGLFQNNYRREIVSFFLLF